MSTLVSVIIPVFNGARFLGETIASVRAQSHAPAEIIVVDDGSNDGSGELAQSLGATVLRQNNRGVAAARNAGIAASHGEILAPLDQDDVWLPEKLRLQIEALNGRPRVVSLVHQEFFLEPPLDRPPRWFSRPDLIGVAHQGWVPSCQAFTRSTFDEIGPYDESLSQASDGDWIARAKAKGIAFETTETLLVRRRLHEANDSSSPTAIRELLHVVRAAASRRRAAGE